MKFVRYTTQAVLDLLGVCPRCHTAPATGSVGQRHRTRIGPGQLRQREVHRRSRSTHQRRTRDLMLISDAEQADLISALASIIRRITDPDDCARRIFNAFDEALVDDFGIDRVAALLDAQVVVEPLPAEIVPEVMAGLKAYTEGRVVYRTNPNKEANT